MVGKKRLMIPISLIGVDVREVLLRSAQDLQRTIQRTLPVDIISILRHPPALLTKTPGLSARCLER